MHINQLFDLSGRVAIVTGGAGRKFGADIVAALGESKAKVVLTSRELGRAEAKAAEYRAQGLDVFGLAYDPGKKGDAEKLVETVLAKHGKLDILFNNASSGNLEKFETIAPEKWNEVIQTNITGVMLLTREAAKPMLAQGRGSIINVSSIYGMVAPDQSIYGDSGLNSPLIYGVGKAALNQMTRYWSTYWAPKIRVNTITPGGFFDNQDEFFLKNYVAKTPLARMAGPGDLKGAAVFLASDASAWVTGQNLVVDGGWTAW